jgi:hypothetical protein
MRFVAIENEYSIREDEAVFSKRRFGAQGGQKTQWLRDGYFYVRLTLNGTPKNYRVHRLLTQAFIPNPNNRPRINHEDGDKTNNKLTNLEWCMASDNLRHAYKLGLKQPTRKAA